MGITASVRRGPPSTPVGRRYFAMVLWRLRNDKDDYADCWLDVTHTGAYRISVRRGGNLKFSALVIGWQAAQQVIDERREELLRQGWQPHVMTDFNPHQLEQL